jgi:hypothetical protein
MNTIAITTGVPDHKTTTDTISIDIDILRRRLDASVLLIKALGGGWNVSNLPTFGVSTVRDY